MNQQKRIGGFQGSVEELKQWIGKGLPVKKGFYDPLRVCALFGSLRIIDGISNAISLIHGPFGCAQFQKIQLLASFFHIPRTPCTGLNEKEVAYGGEDKLKKYLRWVDKKYKPEAIAVLSTCTPAIIGDDIEGIINSLKDELDAKYVFNVKSDGLQYHSQLYGYNEALSAIINKVMQPQRKINYAVNFLGEIQMGGYKTPLSVEKYELKALLSKIGIFVNSVITADSSIEELEKAPRAKLNIARCSPMNSYAAELMEKKFGIPTISPIMPYGLRNTNRWLLDIARFFGLEERAQKVMDHESKKLSSLLDRARKKMKGKTIMVSGGPGRAPAFFNLADELGCKISIFSSYFANKKTAEQIINVVAETGESPIIMIDRGAAECRKVAEECNIETYLGYVMEFWRNYRDKGIPSCDTLTYVSPFAGYSGAKNLLEQIIHRTQHIPF